MLVQSDAIEKRPFDLGVSTIDHYRSIQPFILTELIFLELNRLSPLVGLTTNHNFTKSKSYSNNCDMSIVSDEVF